MTSNTTWAQEAKKSDRDGKAPASPQQYFIDQIQLEAGQPAVETIPEQGFFLNFRAYGPKNEFFDLSWTLDDLKKK